MYKNVTEQFATTIRSPSRTFNLRLNVEGTWIDAGFKKMTYENASCADEYLQLGSTVAAKIELTIKKSDILFDGIELPLEIGLLLPDGTYELGHLEMVSTMVHQLTRNLTMEQIKGTPFEAYYVDHTVGVWPQAAGGVPFYAIEFQSKGDAITDIAEDMAAEQKARSTYDNLLRLCRDDPDVYEPLKFLREREVVHFQRFGEAMSIIQSKLDSKNFYAYNPEFKK